ncbi:NADPH:quinone reductase-like Zn-dependent oxidoreductase [Hoeflea halophila]|uniref:NADPH:quinone reductase-like Zn-dependent oxidoreductase n=1 Tax=Hoeflea halophila TaxID=714899 RepID=A0A286I9S7_9HYPH|nr:NAD(P)-dependent alcohol dehydrogenase [Hoeflea halophila]SOE16812.1 NADPH:quinone reductase-like Zn-dependent oxidoreductase [Hoeflea halophila]
MKAISYSRYGSPGVLKPVTLPKPAPKPDEVLVRIHATSVTSGDYRARSLDMPAGFGLIGRLVFGLFRPRHKILGTEFAGVVEAVGNKVTRFRPGDRVFAYPGATFGGYAEYAAISQQAAIAHVPDNLRLDVAVALSFGGATALDFLRTKGSIKPGDRVLVIGASGNVGSAAVQLAKTFGAHVTGTASTGKRNMVAALGADAVLDYTASDPSGAKDAYDIILDTSGAATYAEYGAALKPGGRLLLASSSLWQMLAALTARKTGGRKAIPGYAPERTGDLRFLAGLARRGQFTPFIDRRFPLDQAAEAHAWLENPARKGNVVITLDTD